MAQQLAPALAELHRLLTDCRTQLQVNFQFALIGGLAVSTWGAIRATQDIDFIADCEPSPIRDLTLREKLRRSLEERNCTIEWRVGGHDDPIALLLRLELPASFKSIGVDILWANQPWQREAVQRAISITVSVPVVHAERERKRFRIKRLAG